MFDFSLQQLLLRIASIFLIVGIHGYGLALAAYYLGDRGPKYDGRLTLNPFTHLDAIGTLTFLLFSLGWIRPVVIDPETFRRPRRDTVVLAMVALLLPIALALVLRMIRPLIFVTLPDSIAFGALAFVNTSIVLSLWFAAFNAIPILPLSADYLLLAAAPHLKKAIAQYELYIKLGLAALIVTGIVRQVISPLYRLLAGWIQGG